MLASPALVVVAIFIKEEVNRLPRGATYTSVDSVPGVPVVGVLFVFIPFLSSLSIFLDLVVVR